MFSFHLLKYSKKKSCFVIWPCKYLQLFSVFSSIAEQLASIIIDINPNEMLNGLSVISIPTEALKIASDDGKLLKISSCVLLFKVKIIEKVPQSGYVCRTGDSSLENYNFESELDLFDSERNGLIEGGEQKVTFSCNRNANLTTLSKQAMWKLKHFVKKTLSLSALGDRQIDGDYMKPARLLFNLQWSRGMCLDVECEKNGAVPVVAAKRRVFTRSISTGSLRRRSFVATKSSEQIQCLVYQFIYKNYRQKTEIWDKLKCPWCSMKAMNLYNLLKHLTLCHDRFKFKYVPGTGENRIDVFVNKNPEIFRFDPLSRLGTRFRGQEPHRRRTMTAVLVCHPERNRAKLSEFFGSFDMTLTGKKRTFYHSTGLPMRSNETDANSEDEMDPAWLRDNTTRMIDDFSDVNAGEKDIMKLWNLHVLKQSYVCESQMSSAAISFVEVHGQTILEQNLYRNCVIHFLNLFDYGLITSTNFSQAIQSLQKLLVTNSSLRDKMFQRVEEQREYTRSKRLKIEQVKAPKRRRLSIIQTTSIKKRLRSHSRNECIRKSKISRSNETDKNQKPTILLTPRAARKSARIVK